MLRREIITAYSENHTIPLNTLHGQTTELLIVRTGGMAHIQLSLSFKVLIVHHQFSVSCGFCFAGSDIY
jgi:hypothetical protein